MAEVIITDSDWYGPKLFETESVVLNTTTASGETYPDRNAARKAIFGPIVPTEIANGLDKLDFKLKVFISDKQWKTTPEIKINEHTLLSELNKRPKVNFSIAADQDFHSLAIPHEDTHQLDEINKGSERINLDQNPSRPLLWQHWFQLAQKTNRHSRQSAAQEHLISDDAYEFASPRGLLYYLDLAYQKVGEFFPKHRELRAELIFDPEGEESLLSIRFITQGSFEEIDIAQQDYHHFWINNVPVAKRLLIGLLYDIDDQ